MLTKVNTKREYDITNTQEDYAYLKMPLKMKYSPDKVLDPNERHIGN